MKAYRGIVKIKCTQESGCLRNLHKNVEPGCVDCPQADTKIVDLEEKVVFEYKSPAERTGKRPGKKKKIESEKTTEIKKGVNHGL